MDTMQTRAATQLAKRGTKRSCYAEDCGHRYYDLNRSPIECPYCGATYTPPVVEARADYRRKPITKIEKPVDEPKPLLVDDEDAVSDTDADAAQVDDVTSDTEDDGDELGPLLEIDSEADTGDDLPGRDSAKGDET